jgi:hypothetical protein
VVVFKYMTVEYNKKIPNQIPIKIDFSLTCAIATKFLVMKPAVTIRG